MRQLCQNLSDIYYRLFFIKNHPEHCPSLKCDLYHFAKILWDCSICLFYTHFFFLISITPNPPISVILISSSNQSSSSCLCCIKMLKYLGIVLSLYFIPCISLLKYLLFNFFSLISLLLKLVYLLSISIPQQSNPISNNDSLNE